MLHPGEFYHNLDQSEWPSPVRIRQPRQKMFSFRVKWICVLGPQEGTVFFLFNTDYHRISELDNEFQGTLRRENNWPIPLPHMPDVCADLVHSIHGLAHNTVCASCGIREHNPALFNTMTCHNTLLDVLSISEDTYVPFDYSCGVHFIDQRCIMIDKSGLSGDEIHITLCNHCNNEIMKGKRPKQSLANYRWIGPIPEELSDLNWVEELLVARGHLVGRIVRVEERKTSSYFALKAMLFSYLKIQLDLSTFSQWRLLRYQILFVSSGPANPHQIESTSAPNLQSVRIKSTVH
jgi:hypothetical protein